MSLTPTQKWEVRERVRLALRYYPEMQDRTALRYRYTRQIIEIVTERDTLGFPTTALALRRWRKRNGYTQVQLAAMLGIATRTLEDIENGRCRYRKVYGMAVAWIGSRSGA